MEEVIAYRCVGCGEIHQLKSSIHKCKKCGTEICDECSGFDEDYCWSCYEDKCDDEDEQ